MRPPLARFLTSMHSPEWKMRYGAEFEALLADIPVSALTVSDVAGSIVASRRRTLVVALGISAVALAVLCAIPKQRPNANLAFSGRSAPRVVCLMLARQWRGATIPCALG
jgi:hypothetical protein